MLNFIANHIVWDADPMLFEFTIPNVNLYVFYFILAFVLFCLPYCLDVFFGDEEEMNPQPGEKKITPLLWKVMASAVGISIIAMLLIGRFGQPGWSLVSRYLIYFIVIYIVAGFFFSEDNKKKHDTSFDLKQLRNIILPPAVAALAFGALLKLVFDLTMTQMWEMTGVSFVAAFLCTKFTLDTPSQIEDSASAARHTPDNTNKRKAVEKKVAVKYCIAAAAALLVLLFTVKIGALPYVPFESHTDIPVSVRWYGLMFAVGFLIGTDIVTRMFRHEGAPEKWVGYLLLFVIVATIVGARLGHVFFYEWDYYSQHTAKIIAFWEGGLASHGGTVAIIIAVYIFSYMITRRSPMWTFDRLVVPIALVGAMIRIGNLMNSEIFGHATDLPWGFMFLRSSEWQQMYASVACHPTQIYESLAYLVLFVVLMWMYWKKNAENRPGLIFGVFLTWLFTARLLIEFLKNPQVAFEESMILNMGQMLSLPFIVAGIYMIVQAVRRPATRAIE